MKNRKKSLWLQAFVFLIIFILLFSVIGVVVVYLRGIQEQSAYNVPVTTTPNDEAGIQIVPKDTGAFTITEKGVEAIEDTEIIDTEGQDTIDIDANIVGEIIGEEEGGEVEVAVEAEGTTEVVAE